MFNYLSILLLVAASQLITGDEVIDGTELVMGFLVHRHGDRTPVKDTISFSTDPDTLEELTAPYGYGQLTEVGAMRGYELGKFIKGRYSELLAPRYNYTEVYVRSTDSTRTKMTVLAALAAMYPPVVRWNKDLDWQPVPYTTVPVKYDFNAPMVNCPKFAPVYSELYMTPAPEESARLRPLLNTLSTALNYNITDMPALVYAIYDAFTSQMSLGLPLGPELDPIFDEIEKAAGETIALTTGVDEYIPLQAGVLLNEFFETSKLAIAGEDTPRLRIYSGHDFNVYSLEAVTKVNRQGAPKYASAYSLEVRKVTSTGSYVVLPVYLPSPGEDPIYLQVEGCDVLCDYEQFIDLTKENALNIEQWREECGFSEDLEIDEASLL